MTARIFIDGDQGTTGLQIVERLQGRGDIVLMQLPSALRKDPSARAAALNGCDIAILCLPDAAARDAVAMITHPQVRVIDASSAHRVAPGWTYGLPELARGQAAAIAASPRVSNPGCYPTGAVALLRPLVDAGLLPADYPLVIHAVSGYSGKGRAGVEMFEGAQAAAASPFQVYGLALAHRHVPEIVRHAGLAAAPVFVPAYGSFRQGIVLTIALHQRLLPASASAERVQAAIAAHHAAIGTAHVQVMPLAAAAALEALDPQALNGSDDLRLAVFENRREGQLLLAAVFDNLGKGAAGAAVQNLDLMLASQSLRQPAALAAA